MIYIDNFSNWITPQFMNHIANRQGDTVPVWQPDRWKGHPMLDEARERARSGYSHRSHDFQQFNAKSKDMQDFDLTLFEIPNDTRPAVWWVVKLLPGQMQAMHFDPHLLETPDPARYTLFLEDWKPGHIFVWDDKIITDYKAGDLYKWEDPMCYHGCVNIGYDTRYTLQITTYQPNK